VAEEEQVAWVEIIVAYDHAFQFIRDVERAKIVLMSDGLLALGSFLEG